MIKIIISDYNNTEVGISSANKKKKILDKDFSNNYDNSIQSYLIYNFKLYESNNKIAFINPIFFV